MLTTEDASDTSTILSAHNTNTASKADKKAENAKNAKLAARKKRAAAKLKQKNSKQLFLKIGRPPPEVNECLFCVLRSGAMLELFLG